MDVLTKKQEESLLAAINAADGWRGTLVGHPDFEVLEEFDSNIRIMRDALQIVKDQQRALRRLKREAGRHKTKAVYCYVGPEDGGCLDIDVLMFS
jgi:hypothetical protein